MTAPATKQPSPNWLRAVVFDLDGTLIDSVGDIAAALNRTLQAHGLASFAIDDVKKLIGGGVPSLIDRALKAQKAPGDVPQAAMVEDFLTFYEADLTSHTIIYDGARDVLAHLKSQGVALGLCTNKPHRLAVQALRQLDLFAYFGAIVGDQDGFARKPAAEPLQRVLAELGVDAADAVMVGDSSADVGCAKAAGVRSVVVSFGYSRTPVEALGANAVIAHLSDLPHSLRTLA